MRSAGTCGIPPRSTPSSSIAESFSAFRSLATRTVQHLTLPTSQHLTLPTFQYLTLPAMRHLTLPTFQYITLQTSFLPVRRRLPAAALFRRSLQKMRHPKGVELNVRTLLRAHRSVVANGRACLNAPMPIL